MKKTTADRDFEQMLDDFAEKLLVINQWAIKEGHEDIKGSTCYIIEIIDTILSNRR